MPRGSVPTVSELEARIDEAVVIARASEEGVREVGEMALDAARQAQRAAEAAEASARAARDAAQAGVAGPAGPVTSDVELETPAPEPPVHFEDRFRRFSERADRLSGRLRRLGAPSHPAGPSVAATRRRGDG